LRYRYIAYKYSRKTTTDSALQNMWESLGSWALPSATVWRPPTDVYETRENLLILMELAGVTEEDMSVTLFSDLLVVEGARAQPVSAEMNACHQLGIKYGEFRSEIFIPVPVDHDNVIADYQNGLLTITLKKIP